MPSVKPPNKRLSKAEKASATVQRLEELADEVCAAPSLRELKALHDKIAKLDVFRAVGPATIGRLSGVFERLTKRIAELGPTPESGEVERIRNTVTSS